jgi:hypothetical protein
MAVVALILLALLGIAKYLGLIWPSQGPLGTTVGYGAGANVKAGSTISLMYQLPDESLAAPIELEDIELLGLDRGLLRGDARVAICPDNGEGCSFAAVEAWPPTAADLHSLPGYVLSGGGNPHIAVEVSVRGLVGATLRSRGALLSYSQGGRRFRTELGPDVRLHVKPE